MMMFLRLGFVIALVFAVASCRSSRVRVLVNESSSPICRSAQVRGAAIS